MLGCPASTGSFSCCSQRGIAKSILTRRSKAREVAPRPITGWSWRRGAIASAPRLKPHVTNDTLRSGERRFTVKFSSPLWRLLRSNRGVQRSPLRIPTRSSWCGPQQSSTVLAQNEAKRPRRGAPRHRSPVSSLTPTSSMDGFGPPHLVRKSNGAGEERPSRRGIKTVALGHSWGSPQSDNCDNVFVWPKKMPPPESAKLRLAKAFGPVRRQT